MKVMDAPPPDISNLGPELHHDQTDIEHEPPEVHYEQIFTGRESTSRPQTSQSPRLPTRYRRPSDPSFTPVAQPHVNNGNGYSKFSKTTEAADEDFVSVNDSEEGAAGKIGYDTGRRASSEIKSWSLCSADLDVTCTNEYNKDVTNANGRNNGEMEESSFMKNPDEESSYLHVTFQSPPPPYEP